MYAVKGQSKFLELVLVNRFGMFDTFLVRKTSNQRNKLVKGTLIADVNDLTAKTLADQ